MTCTNNSSIVVVKSTKYLDVATPTGIVLSQAIHDIVTTFGAGIIRRSALPLDRAHVPALS
jgi:hypothetical protein